jgi:hypothetical protein
VRVNVLLAEDNLADVVMLTEAIRQAGLDYRLRVARACFRCRSIAQVLRIQLPRAEPSRL